VDNSIADSIPKNQPAFDARKGSIELLDDSDSVSYRWDIPFLQFDLGSVRLISLRYKV